MGAGISASLGAFSSLIAGLQPGEMLGGESSRRGGGGGREAASALPPLLRTSSSSRLLLGEMEKSS